MKKLTFMLIATLSVTLTSCSWFERKPLEPQILGVGTLQHDEKSELWIVVIDSAQYAISEITISENSLSSFNNKQYLRPVAGMPVTVFVTPRMQGTHAILGEQSIEQIEAVYEENVAFGLIVFLLIALCFMGVFILSVKKKKSEGKTSAK